MTVPDSVGIVLVIALVLSLAYLSNARVRRTP